MVLDVATLGFTPARAFGVYVHVPFCVRRCPYCDFDIAVRPEVPHQRYLDALLGELDLRAEEVEGRDLATLYFGGGTPSLWAPDALSRVIAEVKARWGNPIEVTLEANPEHLDQATLEAWRGAGISRLSIGAQSLNEGVLSLLGRAHHPRQVRAGIEAALRLGFKSLNVDLIYGVSGQGFEETLSDARSLISDGVSHLSTYSLTIEPKTAFSRRVRRGEQLQVHEDELAEIYARLPDALSSEGFVRYEISNLARAQAWGIHNLLYWLGGTYLGLGLGAHSLRRSPLGEAVRRANTRRLSHYLDAPNLHHTSEEISAEAHLAERLFLHFRTRFGLAMEALEAEVGASLLSRFLPVLSALEGEGLITTGASGWAATEVGLRFHDWVSQRIYEVI